MPPLILASASPRRQELLKQLDPSFETLVSTVEETGSDSLPEAVLSPLPLNAPFSVPADADPRLWAWRKGIDVLSTLTLKEKRGSIVLAADTVVIAQGELLQKPSDLDDARRMLSLLRGRDHFVATGFALLEGGDNGPRTYALDAVLTRVTMRPFTDSDLEGYVATGEHQDKAGAYALQGLGGRLIERLEGCVTNVIGLPLCAVRAALRDAGCELSSYPTGGYCASCMQMGKKDSVVATPSL